MYFCVALGVAWVVALVAIFFYHRGWHKGFDSASDIYRKKT